MAGGVRERTRAVVTSHGDALVALSHSIHADPELAFQEHKSAEKVATAAELAGFAVERGVAGIETAFVATHGTGELVVGVCAEYDALPEIGHACGHNVIAASAVGAAIALASVADDLGVTVKLIGTPAEESGGGKVLMLERGVFDDVALAMMVHPSQHETCACTSLAITDLRVDYQGVSAHAASSPEHGRNAADAITVAQVGLGLLRQHLEPRQMLHGIVTHGGAAPNIVPAATSALYYLRAADVTSLARLEARVRDCFAAGALATGCGHDVVQVSPVYGELTPDPWLTGVYRDVVTQLGRTPMPPAAERDKPVGSTDMGNVTQALPAIHPTMALDCGDAVTHTPEFAAAAAGPSADRTVLDAAVAMAWTAAAAATEDAQRARLLATAAQRAGAAAGGVA